MIKNDIPFWLVIPAAGSGKRMGDATPGDKPKQYQTLAGKPMLQCTLDVFLAIENLKGVVVALNPADRDFDNLPAARNPLLKTVVGGAERCDSVLSGLSYLSAIANADDWVLVHDAARPLVQAHDVVTMLTSLSATDTGGIMAVPVSDTVKTVVQGSDISGTEDRSRLWQAQTPQMFRLNPLLSALQNAKQKNLSITDESSAMERLGYKPMVFQGKRSNIKITVPDDWQMAEFILRQTEMTTSTLTPRIGHGFDVHRFANESPNANVVLGGVTIAHTKKLIAHSDGDVLIHALCDALLGAAALGDIGKHFPDTDNRFKNIDSRVLLRNVVGLLREKNYSIGNVDVTVVAQAPKLLPHMSAICANLSQDLSVDITAVNVKATTTEKLGFEGREEGISCHAVAVIYKS